MTEITPFAFDGAGGVEPLRRRADPDLTHLTERGAAAWAGVDAQALREGRMPPQWVPVDERLPAPGRPVLLDVGGRYPIRAMWAARHTVVTHDDLVDAGGGDYDEATDTYYCPEGWYEWNAHEEVHWSVTEKPRAWMALPEQDRARGAQGGNT